MKYLIGAVFSFALVGCGSSSGTGGQPKLQGTPDPKLQGPVTPGAAPAPAGKGGANMTPGSS